MSDTYDKFKRAMTALDREDWSKVEDLVKRESYRLAIESLLPIVPDVATSYSKAVIVSGLDFDDLIAVGNMAITEAVHSWNEGGISLINWCYIKVKRDIARHVGRELHFLHRTAKELPDEHEDEPVDPSMGADDHISEEQIRDWINRKLTKREAEVVNLVYFKGMRISSIARLQKVSRAFVGKIHQRALIKLKLGGDIFK